VAAATRDNGDIQNDEDFHLVKSLKFYFIRPYSITNTPFVFSFQILAITVLPSEQKLMLQKTKEPKRCADRRVKTPCDRLGTGKVSQLELRYPGNSAEIRAADARLPNVTGPKEERG
jgi:hypothetical protein